MKLRCITIGLRGFSGRRTVIAMPCFSIITHRIVPESHCQYHEAALLRGMIDAAA